jgi:acetylornithine deacetylase/succinyl-diaminopimelate desuccinylase-like protein
MSIADLVKHERIVELLDALVRIPSVTNNEGAIANWMHDYMCRAGLRDVRRLPVAESGDTLVGVLDGPLEGPAMLLNFHLDTFDVFNGWDSDPFVPVVRDNRMYGLGTLDMKGGGACLLAALEALITGKAQLRGRVILACTTDEENWSRGAHALIQSGMLRDCVGALVPEPTPYGALRVGARGRHVITINLKGKSAHIALSDTQSINSAHDAARIIGVLADVENLGLRVDPQFNLRSSLGITGVHSGGTMILVPESARIIVDRHVLPGETLDDALTHLRGLIETAKIAGSYSLSWDERPTPAPGAFIVPESSAFTKIVRSALAFELGRDVSLTLAQSVADVNHIAVHGAVPTLTMGPWGGNTCEANEWIDLDSLVPIARAHVNAVLGMLG